MKLKIKCLNLFALISLIGVMISLIACGDKETKVVVRPIICCTSDLLEFVTPVVTIQGDNGEKESFRLTKEDFNNRVNLTDQFNFTFIFNGVPTTTTSTLSYGKWVATTPMITFQDVKAMKGTITVKYEPNSNADINKEKYVFFSGNELGYTSEITIDDVTHKGPEETYNIETVGVYKDDVEKYISDLCATEKSISFDVK